MGRLTKSRWISLALALGVAAIAVPSLGVEPVNPFAQRLLDAHNRERADAGVPPLEWSDKLAREAREWADTIALEGRMRHADRATRGTSGENIWMGTAGRFSAEDMIDTFTRERRYYRHRAFPDISTTGRWQDVGHYTQVVWRNTQQVGCAVAQNGEDDFLVCRYWPAGNWEGEIAF